MSTMFGTSLDVEGGKQEIGLWQHTQDTNVVCNAIGRDKKFEIPGLGSIAFCDLAFGFPAIKKIMFSNITFVKSKCLGSM